MTEQAQLSSNSEVAVAEPIKYCCAILRKQLDRVEERAGLVVGCGRGDEVVYLRRALGIARLAGLDLSANFSCAARRDGKLLAADAKLLPFRNEAFDFAVAIHSLEHVGEPRRALAEVQRTLRRAGWFYLGVPNRMRLLGYLGAPGVSLWQKFSWNVIDYGQRLRGRFRNELGAHAGFEAKELETLLREYFEEVEILTEAYLRFKYAHRLPRRLLNFLLSPRLINYSAPAHYALCRKQT